MLFKKSYLKILLKKILKNTTWTKLLGNTNRNSNYSEILLTQKKLLEKYWESFFFKYYWKLLKYLFKVLKILLSIKPAQNTCSKNKTTGKKNLLKNTTGKILQYSKILLEQKLYEN